MALKRLSKFAAVALTAAMIAEAGLSSFVPLTVEAKEAVEAQVEEAAVMQQGMTILPGIMQQYTLY